MDRNDIVRRFNNWLPEPVICSQGGVPVNKAHLDAKDAEIERLRARVAELEMILINHR